MTKICPPAARCFLHATDQPCQRCIAVVAQLLEQIVAQTESAHIRRLADKGLRVITAPRGPLAALRGALDQEAKKA